MKKKVILCDFCNKQIVGQDATVVGDKIYHIGCFKTVKKDNDLYSYIKHKASVETRTALLKRYGCREDVNKVLVDNNWCVVTSVTDTINNGLCVSIHSFDNRREMLLSLSQMAQIAISGAYAQNFLFVVHKGIISEFSGRVSATVELY